MTSLALRIAVPSLAGMMCLLALGPVHAERSLAEFTQPSLRDIAANVKVVWKDDRELAKIGKGYEEAYTLSDQQIWCKEPDRVRVQGRRGFLRVRFITDGLRRLTEIATLHIHRVENIAREPSKANNISDLGVITPEWLHHVQAEWVASREMNGKKVEVFDFSYPQDPDVRHTIALDPHTHTIVEHLAHYRRKADEGFKRKIVYSEVRQIGGVAIPTTANIYNGEDKLAARMQYDSIKVNTDLNDSLFRF